MAKPEWGMKRLCGSCGCRFYDMARTPVTCPKCGAAHDTDPPARSRRSAPAAEAKAAPAAAAKALPTDEALIELDDDALAALEDALQQPADAQTLVQTQTDRDLPVKGTTP